MVKYQLAPVVESGQAVTSITVAGEKIVTSDRGPYEILAWDEDIEVVTLVERRAGAGRGDGVTPLQRFIDYRGIQGLETAHATVAPPAPK